MTRRDDTERCIVLEPAPVAGDVHTDGGLSDFLTIVRVIDGGRAPAPRADTLPDEVHIRQHPCDNHIGQFVECPRFDCTGRCREAELYAVLGTPQSEVLVRVPHLQRAVTLRFQAGPTHLRRLLGLFGRVRAGVESRHHRKRRVPRGVVAVVVFCDEPTLEFVEVVVEPAAVTDTDTLAQFGKAEPRPRTALAHRLTEFDEYPQACLVAECCERILGGPVHAAVLTARRHTSHVDTFEYKCTDG